MTKDRFRWNWLLLLILPSLVVLATRAFVPRSNSIPPLTPELQLKSQELRLNDLTRRISQLERWKERHEQEGRMNPLILPEVRR